MSIRTYMEGVCDVCGNNVGSNGCWHYTEVEFQLRDSQYSNIEPNKLVLCGKCVNHIFEYLNRIKRERDEKGKKNINEEYQPKPKGTFGYQPVNKSSVPPSPPTSGSNIVTPNKSTK